MKEVCLKYLINSGVILMNKDFNNLNISNCVFNRSLSTLRGGFLIYYNYGIINLGIIYLHEKYNTLFIKNCSVNNSFASEGG